MKTKLVYVLTSAPDAMYIEQALMAVWSARFRNPDAFIVLITDDQTDKLLKGKRGEILRYISEKIVVPFVDEQLSPLFRSRWIKTHVRQMISGDFLYVDSDTICQRPLSDIDTFECEIGAVMESHLPVNAFCNTLLQTTKKATQKIGVDIEQEQYYFSSGVLVVKDTEKTRQLYELWHRYWKEGSEIGLRIDQPSLAKANREIGHIIKQIPDTYNCILFTRPPFVREAHILHISAHQNPSFLFEDKVLEYVRANGLDNQWLQKMILNPCATIMPFDYNLKHSKYKERRQWRKELADAWKGYGKYIDSTYEDFPMPSRFRVYIIQLLRRGFFRLGLSIWFMVRRIRLHQRKVVVNYCQK